MSQPEHSEYPLRLSWGARRRGDVPLIYPREIRLLQIVRGQIQLQTLKQLIDALISVRPAGGERVQRRDRLQLADAFDVVLIQDLQEITALAPEHEKVAGERILSERNLNQHRQAIEALAHVGCWASAKEQYSTAYA